MPLTVAQVGKFAGQLDLVFESGAAFDLEFTWWDLFWGDGDARNEPKDLTGYTASLRIRQKPNSEIYLYETTEVGDLTLGGALGTIALNLTAADTAAFAWPGRAYWVLELTDPSSHVFRFLEGRASID